MFLVNKHLLACTHHTQLWLVLQVCVTIFQVVRFHYCMHHDLHQSSRFSISWFQSLQASIDLCNYRSQITLLTYQCTHNETHADALTNMLTHPRPPLPPISQVGPRANMGCASSTEPATPVDPDLRLPPANAVGADRLVRRS